MNPEITKIIEQYLANELSLSDKIAFEKKLAESKSLQNEVIRQQNIHAAAKRASKRTEIQQIGKSYHFFKKVLTTGIVVAVIVVVSSLGYLAYKMTSGSESDFANSEEVKALIEKLKKESPIDELASEFFFWEGKDSVILSDEGVLLSVPENAFLLKGKPYNEKAIIQWQEAMDPATIVKSGLSTMAGDRLLETQGMFGVQAYTKDGQKLDVNPKVGVYVQVPVDQYKSGMQLFTGSTNKDGIIDWKNPKPLQKIPVPVDMKELDFYPKGYENALNEMKKSKKKAYRDSLYLSLDEVGEYLTEPVSTDSTAIYDFSDFDEEKPNINLNQSQKIAEEIRNLRWNLDVRYEENGFATIIGRVPLANNWNIYSELDRDKTNNLHTNGRVGVQTKLKFDQNENYRLIGNVKHSGKFIAQDNEGRIEQISEDEAIFKQRIKIINKQPFDLVLNYTMQVTNYNLAPTTYNVHEKINITPVNDQLSSSDTISKTSQFISPTKVMAFWKPQFNKTLLATREFERRMQSIHTTCDNKVLNLYTSNLSKSIQEIDEMAVSMGYPVFAEFAKEQIGALNPNSPHLKGLQSFYEREIKKLKRIVEANAKYDQKKKERRDKEIQKERDYEKNRTQNRNQKNFEEEFTYNLDNVYKQLGIEKKKIAFRQFTKTIGFTVFRGGAYNIDKYVYDATVKRRSTVIVDPSTGKQAQLTYNPFSFDVKESNKYGRLYAYLFPSQLNSYQRIDGTKGKFNYPLNGDIAYDFAIVGISDQGYFYHEVRGVQKGNLGSLSLTTITEKEFNQKITSLNESRGIIKPMGIANELYWLIKEQKNYKEEKRRNENAEFRNKIKKVIFPCYQGEMRYEFTTSM